MEKIAKIAGLAIILLLVVFIGFSYLAAPPADKLEALRAFVQISKLYADKKVIDPNKVEEKNADFEYIKDWAVYLRAITDAERNANAQRRIMMQALEVGNLRNLAAVESGLDKLQEFVEISERSNNESFNAINVFVAEVAKLDLEDSLFSAEGAKELGASEVQYFNELNSYRVAVTQYLEAVLKFFVTREGLYTVDGNMIRFNAPEDQQYLNEMLGILQRYNNEIDLLSNAHREQIRRDINSIFDE